MTLYFLADVYSRALNPTLCLVLLLERGGPRVAWRFWVRAALAIGLAVGLAKLGKSVPIWPGHSGFPSGHTTFAATACLLLVLQRGRRWVVPGIALTVLMMASLVYGGWHTLSDTLGALVLALGVSALVWRATRGWLG